MKFKFGVKRERAPFVLTPDFVYLMDQKGARFGEFVNLCIRGYAARLCLVSLTLASSSISSSASRPLSRLLTRYLSLRRRFPLLISLMAMMLSTGIPELRTHADIRYLESALDLDRTEKQASEDFEQLIHKCLKLSWSTMINFWCHNLAH